MYTEKDLSSIKEQMNKRLIILTVIYALLASVMVYFIVTRNRIPTYISSMVLLCFIIFSIDIIFMPLRRYYRFIDSLLHGIRREIDGTFLSFEKEDSLIEGVHFYSIFVCDDDPQDPADRLFYYDVMKKDPMLQIGDKVHVIYQDKQIFSISKL